jgi:predicted O-methyltransferase YrrM
MTYLDKTLTFVEGKISYPDATSHTGERAVMMDWEAPIMAAHAQYVAENKGRILEIGFGLGISAGYIQSYNPQSHTIVEIHPDIITKAKNWAVGKQGVNIIEGDWFEVREAIRVNGPYDGIFYDTYGDKNLKYLIDFCTEIIAPGGRFTLWNSLPYPLGREQQKMPNATTTYSVLDLKQVNIPDNDYFNSDVYYLPKIQF